MWALVALLLATGSPVAAAQASDPPEARLTTVRLELLPTRHISVPVRVNGEGPFRLVFDTGSPLTFISTRVAEKVGLITPEQAKQNAFLGMRGWKRVKSIAVGDLTLNDLNVLILDHPVIEMVGQVSGGLDGIVGFSFFARYRTTIDYQNRTLSFAPGDFQPAEIMSTMLAAMSRDTEVRRVIAPAGLWGIGLAAAERGPETQDPLRGVRVDRVFAGTPAATAGLRPGDRILTVDRRWTDTPADLFEAAAGVRAGRLVMVRLVRGEREMEVRLRPAAGL